MSIWSIFLVPVVIAGALVVFILLAYGLLATTVIATLQWLWS